MADKKIDQFDKDGLERFSNAVEKGARGWIESAFRGDNIHAEEYTSLNHETEKTDGVIVFFVPMRFATAVVDLINIITGKEADRTLIDFGVESLYQSPDPKGTNGSEDRKTGG